MPRPSRCRRIERLPVFRSFSPDDITEADNVYMSVDEFEALRLLDDEGLNQEACAARMNISRTTVTAIYDSARKKVAEALVHGKRLLITGGHCEFEPVRIDQNIIEKGNDSMRIAATYENGEVFQHFGHTEQFKLYDIEDGKIVNEQIVDTNGSGHGELAGFLQALKVDALICGGVGIGAQLALEDAGIRLYAGVEGPADEAVKELAEGTLKYETQANCSHEHHGEKEGGCGEEHGEKGGHGEGKGKGHGKCHKHRYGRDEENGNGEGKGCGEEHGGEEGHGEGKGKGHGYGCGKGQGRGKGKGRGGEGGCGEDE